MTLLVNPLPRYSSQMAELTGTGKIVLFSGKTTANTNGNGLLNDCYVFQSGQWSAVSGILPPARAEGMMAYDGTNITLCAGTNGFINLSDQWQFSGTSWSKPSLSALTIPYTRPTTLSSGVMCWQSAGPENILYSGKTPYNREYNLDTWTFSAPATWTLTTQTISPPARIFAAAASSSLKMVVFGGKNFDGNLSDCWVNNGTSWSNATAGVAGVDRPSARAGSALIYDSSTSLYILFGGITANGVNNETWTYNVGTNIWTNVSPSISPPPMVYHSFCYNSTVSSSLLFGGKDTQQVFGQTWIFNSTLLTWTRQ